MAPPYALLAWVYAAFAWSYAAPADAPEVVNDTLAFVPSLEETTETRIEALLLKGFKF